MTRTGSDLYLESAWFECWQECNLISSAFQIRSVTTPSLVPSHYFFLTLNDMYV